MNGGVIDKMTLISTGRNGQQESRSCAYAVNRPVIGATWGKYRSQVYIEPGEDKFDSKSEKCKVYVYNINNDHGPWYSPTSCFN